MPTGWIAPEELSANMMMTTPATGRKLKRIWYRVGNSFKKRAESPIAKIGIRDNITPVNEHAVGKGDAIAFAVKVGYVIQCQKKYRKNVFAFE